MNLHVISHGPLTTVQDAGRTGYAARGFRTCGAADGILGLVRKCAVPLGHIVRPYGP